jgi:hypothetical protein
MKRALSKGFVILGAISVITLSSFGATQTNSKQTFLCRWKPGMAPIEYIVESLHTDSSGSRGITRAHSFLKC